MNSETQGRPDVLEMILRRLDAVDEIKIGMSRLEQRMGRIEIKLDVLEATSREHTAAIFELSSDVKEIKSRLERVETIVSGHTESIKEIKTIVSGHTESFKEIKTIVSGHTESIAAMRGMAHSH